MPLFYATVSYLNMLFNHICTHRFSGPAPFWHQRQLMHSSPVPSAAGWLGGWTCTHRHRADFTQTTKAYYTGHWYGVHDSCNLYKDKDFAEHAWSIKTASSPVKTTIRVPLSCGKVTLLSCSYGAPFRWLSLNELFTNTPEIIGNYTC